MKYGIAFISLVYFLSSFIMNNSAAQADKTPFAQVVRNLEALRQAETQEFTRLRLKVMTETQRPITVLTSSEELLSLKHRLSSLHRSSNMSPVQKEILGELIESVSKMLTQVAELSTHQFEQCFDQSTEAVKIFNFPGVTPSIPLSIDQEMKESLDELHHFHRLA
jgi:hypothetical protein